jgi:translation initiation factor IF-2
VHASSPRILQPGGRWGSFTAGSMQRLGSLMLRGGSRGSGAGSASSGGGAPARRPSGGSGFPGGGGRTSSGSGGGGRSGRGAPPVGRSLSALPRLSVELAPALAAAGVGVTSLDESEEPLEVEGAEGRV